VESQRAEHGPDLREFGVKFDVIFFESVAVPRWVARADPQGSRRRGAAPTTGRRALAAHHGVRRRQDRVLRKSDGTYTYCAARHRLSPPKARRGFALAHSTGAWGRPNPPATFGPHAGRRCQSLGYPRGPSTTSCWCRLVRVMRGGMRCRFREAVGQVRTLRDLSGRPGVGRGALLVFLMRRGTPVCVRRGSRQSQTDRTPVFLRQMAHARMSRHLPGGGAGARLGPRPRAWTERLVEPEEATCLREVAAFPGIVRAAAETLEPHRVTATSKGCPAGPRPLVPQVAVLRRGLQEAATPRSFATAVRRVARQTASTFWGSAPRIGLSGVCSWWARSARLRCTHRSAKPRTRPADRPVFLQRRRSHPRPRPDRWRGGDGLSARRSQDARGAWRGPRTGVEQAPGECVRLEGPTYSYDLASRETLENPARRVVRLPPQTDRLSSATRLTCVSATSIPSCARRCSIRVKTRRSWPADTRRVLDPILSATAARLLRQHTTS